MASNDWAVDLWFHTLTSADWSKLANVILSFQTLKLQHRSSLCTSTGEVCISGPRAAMFASCLNGIEKGRSAKMGEWNISTEGSWGRVGEDKGRGLPLY